MLRAERRVKKNVRVPRPVAVDFETFEAEPRPWGPAVPTGVSIKYPGKKSRYYAWGHVSGNNCTWAEARDALVEAWAWPDGVVFHNCKFDLTIAYERMDMPELPWERVHDTMFLGFLDDPNERELGLKPMGLRILGMEAEERDAVAEWLCRAQPVPGVRIQPAVGSKNTFMKYLPFAPGDVVGRYADGDDLRTEKLFQELYRSVVVERDMGAAYDRERRIIHLLLENEKLGIRVDVPRLREDVARYARELARVRAWVVKKLGMEKSADFNPDSPEQVLERVFALGWGDPATWPQTEKSTPLKVRHSAEGDAFQDHCTEKQFSAVWSYKGKLSWAFTTCLENWLRVAEASGGWIYTDWHQVRGAEGGGARTGRLSSSPNFQNLSAEISALFKEHEDDPEKRKALVKAPWPDLLPLPNLRSYILADEGHILCGRDFSSQELRILAHFEEGPMMKSYIEKPDTDFHQYAADLITRLTGIRLTRKMTKTIAFSILYGSGIAKLAATLGVSVAEAKLLKESYLKTFPGIKQVQDRLKALAAMSQPALTWGRREFRCEPPRVIQGKMRSFEYRMLNTLIQGSAADYTKEAMARFYELKTEGRIILSVHDELILSVPKAKAQKVMRQLRDCMNGVELRVPMLSDGEMGNDWGNMREAA